MITENGIVTRIDPSKAWVKTIRSGACESCSTKESCTTAVNQKEMVVSVLNTLSVKEGDHVVIGLNTRPMLVLTFMLYIFPILLLITGAVIGDSLAPVFGLSASASAMLFGFSFFGLAFLIIRKKHRSMAAGNTYKPFLVRKKSQVIPTSCSTK